MPRPLHPSKVPRMFLSAVAVVLSTLLLGYASGQDLNCSALNIDQPVDNPLTGVSLDVCQTDSEQCCTQEYLNGVRRRIRQGLLEGLRNEVNNRGVDIQEILDIFSTYLEGDFISGIRGNIPLSRFLDDADEITAALADFLSRANFAITSASPELNTTQVFVDIINQIEAAIRGSDRLNNDQQDCIVDELRRHVSRSSLATLGRTLESLRRSFTGFNRILGFVGRFATNLDGFTLNNFPAVCVDRLTELAICGRCRRRIPPLCRNSCGALVQGCFAAFYSGLEREFDNLWNVLRQLVEAAGRAISELFEAENDLLDIDLLQLVGECNLGSLLGRKKRQTQVPELMLPERIMERVQTLSGVFKYATTGPRFCQLESEEEEFCSGRDNDVDDRSCDSDEVCTSTCQCWDGEEMRGTDITKFTGVGIRDQGDNPVITIPEEVNLLIATQRSSVVNSFLTSEEFTEVMPEGVTIPPPTTFGPTTFGPTTLGDGSVPLVVSMVTVLGTVLFAMLIVGA